MGTSIRFAGLRYRIAAAPSKLPAVIPYLACMMTVAMATHLPPRILPVISVLEGGTVGMVREDANGTADLGVMQVNSIWVPVLAARARLSQRQTRDALIKDPCFNIAAASFVLRVYLQQTHGALLPAIGDYHSHTLPLNQQYVRQAEQTAERLFDDSGAR